MTTAQIVQIHTPHTLSCLRFGSTIIHLYRFHTLGKKTYQYLTIIKSIESFGFVRSHTHTLTHTPSLKPPSASSSSLRPLQMLRFVCCRKPRAQTRNKHVIVAYPHTKRRQSTKSFIHSGRLAGILALCVVCGGFSMLLMIPLNLSIMCSMSPASETRGASSRLGSRSRRRTICNNFTAIHRATKPTYTNKRTHTHTHARTRI